MGRGPKTPRTPRRVEAHTTRLEAVDDSLGPLGPLGDNAPMRSEPAPVPPSKEQSLPTRTRQSTAPADSRSMMDSVDLGDDGDSTAPRPRHPPPVQPPSSGIENSRRQTQPSVSIEQAAKPSFDITVGDPHKVGDLTSSHIVYQVRTKVGISGARLYHMLTRTGRQLQRRINNPNSQSADDIGTFYGFTTHYTPIAQA